jgi:hypothetical protein
MSACQTYECVDTHSCLPSYNNASICGSLRPGTSERELIFKLGQPVKREGVSLFFANGAAEAGPVVELDSEGLAKQLHCTGLAQQNAAEDALRQRASER